MTPEAKYQSEGKTVFLEVAPETKSCTVATTNLLTSS